MQDVMPGTSVEEAAPVRFSEIVPVVLREVARRRGEGELTQAEFEEKLARLEAEELAPARLALLVRDLANGATRFMIKETRTGRICKMIDCERKSKRAPVLRRPRKKH
jgi:hypothetical protein